MAGTIEEETERLANAVEALVDIFDGTTTGTPVLSIVTALNAIDTKLGTHNTHMSNSLTQITGINSGISGGFGTHNSNMTTLLTRLATIATEIDQSDATLALIKTSIDAITVNVTLQQSDVATAIENQTAARLPLQEQATIQKDVRRGNLASRTPTKPGATR